MTAERPSTRILAVLELLQTHGRITGQELADRLGVDRRTVRRYIVLLEEMGIPVRTERGPAGGYELAPGFKLPPMMFAPDEALALGLGLAAVRSVAPPSLARPAASARAKLERVMPAEIKARLRAAVESVSFERFGATAAEGGEFLPAVSACAHGKQGLRLGYRSPAGSTERDFDPYGLVFREGRWYVAGFCHLRRAVRTFRLDRIVSAAPQSRRFERPEGFDAAAHLTWSLATLPQRFAIEVWLATDLDAARRELFPAMGVLEPSGRGVLMRSQADDLDWFARELARLPFRLEVRRPGGLRRALAKLGRALAKDHGRAIRGC